MANWLRQWGFRPYAPDLVPSSGSAGLDRLAKDLRTFVDTTLREDEQFDLIGFSMGGLISRYYVQRLGGMARVGRLITISTPHHGTYTAYALANRGSKQMRRGSEFLQDLNDDVAMLTRVRVASIWTPFDLMIVPARSSCLGIGEEISIPVLVHPWMLRDERCLAAVRRLLGSSNQIDHS